MWRNVIVVVKLKLIYGNQYVKISSDLLRNSSECFDVALGEI